MESKCFSMDLIFSSEHFSRSSILKARYNGVLDVVSFLMGFSFCFIFINWKNNISYIRRTNGISLQAGCLQGFYFATIWHLDSSPISFSHNLPFGSTQYHFYLNSSKILISDFTMYRLFNRIFRSKTSTVRLVMRGKFHKQ